MGSGTAPARAIDRSRPPADPSERQLRLTLSGRGPRYRSADGRFAVWAAELADGTLTVACGALGAGIAGETLVCDGQWEQSRFGWSFRVRSCTATIGVSPRAVAAWLALRLPGIGQRSAEAIAAHFGAENVYPTLDADPQRLREVRTASGRLLPASVLERAILAWPALRTPERQTDTFLLGAGCSPKLLETLYRHYGDRLVDLLDANPYALTEVPGVGFHRADRVARALGLGRDDERRLDALVLYLLDSAASEGHVLLSRSELLAQTAAHGVPERDAARAAVRRLARSGRVVVEPGEAEPVVYRPDLHALERRVGMQLRDLLSRPPKPLLDPAAVAAAQLNREQQDAVSAALSYHLVALTGAAGTGKTFTVSVLCGLLEQAGVPFALCAPTGKAARRLQALGGRPAETVHRLLEYEPARERFARNRKRPLETRVVIVDESSMLSLDLAGALLDALAPAARLVLVGDPEQLPPVGLGRPFADLVAAGTLGPAHVELAEVQRTAAHSLLVRQAARVRQGELPLETFAEAQAAVGVELEQDFVLQLCADAEAVAARTLALTRETIPRLYRIDPREIVVLAPVHNGTAGLDALNEQLERQLNPHGQPIAGTRFRSGARVIASCNDYANDVQNGTLAEILRAKRRLARLRLDDGRELELGVRELERWLPARAISVHRFQGSEADYVVVALAGVGAPLVDRTLLYTALTRARKLGVLVCDKRSLAIAVHRTNGSRRCSQLARRINDPAASLELV